MKTQKRQIKFLERKEIERLIASIKPEGARALRDIALFEVLFSTGMRIHEALALLLREMNSLTSSNTAEITIIGKGGWQRVVFISPRAMNAVRRYVAVRDDILDEERLFPITIRCAQLMVKRRAEAAGIEKRVTPHIFRHSLATDLLRRGVDIRVVQEFLGHRSISSTQVYTHVTNGQLKNIHTKLYK